MASLVFSSALGMNSKSPSLETTDRSMQLSDGSSFGNKSILPRKPVEKKLLTTTTNVASKLPIAIPSHEKESPCDQKLVAWTSIRQERWEGELQVEGQIPLWLKGTYLRNGPGLWNIGDYNFRHLFDGYATLVRLHFENGKLIMGHRQIESDAYKAAKKNNKLCYREFSEAPKPDNFLAYIGDLANLFSGASLTDNANTGIVRLGDGRVVCLTETIKGSIVVDPYNLDTLGKFEYSDKLGGLIHSAHPIVTDTEFLTLLPDLINPGYLVARMDPGTNERKVIGRVDCRGGPSPGWVHSFPITEHYVVVPEMPLRYCAQNLLKAEPTPLYKFEWHPESKGFFHVMCKASGSIVASVEVPLFVTFHFINAYEEKDKDGRVTAVIADCCEHYADTTILDNLRLQNLRSSSGKNVLPDARVGRFTIPLDGSPYGTLEAALPPEEHGKGMDMCSINPNYLGKKYRYAYACGAQRPCNFPNTLTKVDLVEKAAKNWYNKGSVPSEPFFVPRPGATEEDDGVVISMISGENDEGYALLLDGKTFEEIARAKFPYGLPYGLHGCWVPKVGRFTIPLDGSPYGTLEAALPPEEHGKGMDMCSINPNYLGENYRYAYACGTQRPCNFPNTLTKAAKNWYDKGSIPSEPFFVPRPGTTEEDDGVVISMISGKNDEGYALLLDGKTFEEIARAKFPYGLPYGLHGCWVPKS